MRFKMDELQKATYGRTTQLPCANKDSNPDHILLIEVLQSNELYSNAAIRNTKTPANLEGQKSCPPNHPLHCMQRHVSHKIAWHKVTPFRKQKDPEPYC